MFNYIHLIKFLQLRIRTTLKKQMVSDTDIILTKNQYNLV